jgi:hypothetical protein
MSNPDRCRQMAVEVTKQLAEESKRDAKGVSWERYQAVCDRNEGLEYEVEELKAKVAELKVEAYELDVEFSSVVAELNSKSDINKIKADAIREAAKSLCWYRGLPNTVDASELNDYADKLESGTL